MTVFWLFIIFCFFLDLYNTGGWLLVFGGILFFCLILALVIAGELDLFSDLRDK